MPWYVFLIQFITHIEATLFNCASNHKNQCSTIGELHLLPMKIKYFNYYHSTDIRTNTAIFRFNVIYTYTTKRYYVKSIAKRVYSSFIPRLIQYGWMHEPWGHDKKMQLHSKLWMKNVIYNEREVIFFGDIQELGKLNI